MIEKYFKACLKLPLKLHDDSIKKAANAYIGFKTQQLLERNEWTHELWHFASAYMRDTAECSFLWAAVVCENLEGVQPWDVKDVLLKFPQGLRSIYEHMLELIGSAEGLSLVSRHILGVVAISCRPVTLEELPIISSLPDGLDNPAWLLRAITGCGCFIHVCGDTIEFVHTTAQEFIQDTLLGNNEAQTELHDLIYRQSARSLLQILHYNIYKIPNQVTSITDVATPGSNPLAGIKYALIYWPHHFVQGTLNVEGLKEFLEHSLLFCIEAASLQRCLPQLIMGIDVLARYIEVSKTILATMNTQIL